LVEAEYEARCPSPALRAAGRAQGRGLKRAAARSGRLVVECPAEQHAVVLGVAANAAGLSPVEAASLALHAVLMGTAAAAVRLLPIDMAEPAAAVRLLRIDMADAAAAVAGLAALADEIATQTPPILEPGSENGHKSPT